MKTKLLGAAATALLALLLPGTAAAGPGPDLVVTYLSGPPRSLVTGADFNLVDVVRNPGRRAAPASTRVLFLSFDRRAGRGDYRLPAKRAVRSLGIGRSARGSQVVEVPAGVPSGTYWLLACADGLRRVRETNEGNNCRASAWRVELTAFAATHAVGYVAPENPHLPNPLLRGVGWLNPESAAAVWMRRYRREGRLEEARQLQKIAEQPVGNWFGDWNGVCNIEGEICGIEKVVSQRAYWAEQQGSQALLVTYALPNRVCTGETTGNYVGGFASDAAYREWIREYAQGIGTKKAIVIVEPDAVPDVRCMTSEERRRRLGLVRYAVERLTALPNTTVYIDAGRSGWRPVGEITAYLREAGLGMARGFSLNVTGTNHTRDEMAYGRAIAKLTGGKHFVINTSRNGLGPLPQHLWRSPKDQWCNPPGRALGPRPSPQTGDPLADGFLWIRSPGESETVCYPGHPPAGVFWPEYAVGLAQRAAY